MSDDRRFCPIHGEYIAIGQAARCPSCAQDPMVSSAELQRVRVITEEELDPGGHDPNLPTPMADEFPCPVCGTMTRPRDFKVEVPGEVWKGEAAVWAEEGVCPDCYREVMSEHIREWTQPEWLVHHYEGWRATVDTVHNIFVYEDSPQESWLPLDERHRILDVEKTLAARREHLARCQMSMKDLQTRYDAKITPPPFQMTLASGSRALEQTSVAELKAMRARDLDVEMERRDESMMGMMPRPEVIDSHEDEELLPPPRRAWVAPLAVLLLAAAAVLVLRSVFGG